MKRNRPQHAPTAWQSSAQWRLIGSTAISEWNAERPNLPKCNAARKRDREPCQLIAMENGKCFIHGGRTPRGDEWHRTQWPDAKSPDAEKSFRKKLAERERAAKKRSIRLAAMSPEERARYEAWHAAHRPGSAAARQRDRDERKQAAEVRAMTDRPRPAPSAESVELEHQIAALRAELEALRIHQPKPVGAFA